VVNPMIASGQFRFAYFTPLYDLTVAFYRDGLGLPVVEAWDRSPEDRGTLFGAASGLIEVLASPQSNTSDHLFDERPPQGAFMVIEVQEAAARYQQIKEKGLVIQQELKDQAWGHRSFCVFDPNGLTIYFFSEIEKQGK
jgi:catechol 2,3-dioxygenase-like lactoylglutathione lyase family enzyme